MKQTVVQQNSGKRAKLNGLPFKNSNQTKNISIDFLNLLPFLYHTICLPNNLNFLFRFASEAAKNH